MATNFPGSADSFTNPTSGSSLSSPSHADQHTNVNDAVEAIETALLDGAPLHIDDANQRVGIGTTSPQVELHLKKGSGAGATFDIYHDIVVDSDGNGGMAIYTPNTSNGYFRFGDNDSSYSGGFQYDHPTDLLRIRAGGTDRVFIDSSGNVGIGTGSPSYTLHVNGSARTSSIDTSSFLIDNYYHSGQPAGRIYSYASGSVAGWSSGATSDGTRYHMRFSSPSYLGVGGIYTYNGNTYYANYSDYRLKDNVAPLANASDIVANLNPVSYTMRHNPETTHLGFLAHELQEHIPSAVGGTKDEVDDEGNPVYQNVDLTKVVPVLTAALQEALTTINELTARIEALEAG